MSHWHEDDATFLQGCPCDSFDAVSKFILAEVYYELSEEKVCQFYAELLLRAAGKVSFVELSKLQELMHLLKALHIHEMYCSGIQSS